MKHLTLLLIAATAVLSAQAGPYRVTMPVTADDQGAVAYLLDRTAGGTAIDSVMVEGPELAFTGDIDGSAIARITIDGRRRAQFILEPGTITIVGNQATGTPLNQAIQDFDKAYTLLGEQYKSAADDATRQAIMAQAEALSQNAFKANLDNAFGAMLLAEQVYDMNLAQYDSLLAQAPALKGYPMITKYREGLEKAALTGVGGKMVDFAITQPDGTVKKLSDYVGRGKWTLVDFWASWCGPCRREIPNIKDLLAQYGPDGLEVLGVAVWDKPYDSRRAIEQLGITWPVIIDAQTIPTDLYGISGIPTIILFDPEGNIVSRGKQGDDLRADVARALGK